LQFKALHSDTPTVQPNSLNITATLFHNFVDDLSARRICPGTSSTTRVVHEIVGGLQLHWYTSLLLANSAFIVVEVAPANIRYLRFA
jgi:hypothetical protein